MRLPHRPLSRAWRRRRGRRRGGWRRRREGLHFEREIERGRRLGERHLAPGGREAEHLDFECPRAGGELVELVAAVVAGSGDEFGAALGGAHGGAGYGQASRRTHRAGGRRTWRRRTRGERGGCAACTKPSGSALGGEFLGAALAARALAGEADLIARNLALVEELHLRCSPDCKGLREGNVVAADLSVGDGRLAARAGDGAGERVAIRLAV